MNHATLTVNRPQPPPPPRLYRSSICLFSTPRPPTSLQRLVSNSPSLLSRPATSRPTSAPSSPLWSCRTPCGSTCLSAVCARSSRSLAAQTRSISSRRKFAHKIIGKLDFLAFTQGQGRCTCSTTTSRVPETKKILCLGCRPFAGGWGLLCIYDHASRARIAVTDHLCLFRRRQRLALSVRATAMPPTVQSK